MTATLVISLNDQKLGTTSKELSVTMSVPPTTANIETVLTIFRGMIVSNVQPLLQALASDFQALASPTTAAACPDGNAPAKN